MVVLAFLTDPPVVRRILDHLDLPSVAPRLSPGRCDDDGSLPLARDERDGANRAISAFAAPRSLPPRSPP
jgi:hypothetical protein